MNENESISSNDLNLIAYINNWIPSVTIGDPYESEVRHNISLILKCEDFVFELQGDELRLVELGRQLITSSTWDTLMGGTSPIGLKTPFHTETGLAFGLNLNDLLMNTYGSLLNNDTSLTDFINELSLDPPEFG